MKNKYTYCAYIYIINSHWMSSVNILYTLKETPFTGCSRILGFCQLYCIRYFVYICIIHIHIYMHINIHTQAIYVYTYIFECYILIFNQKKFISVCFLLNLLVLITKEKRSHLSISDKEMVNTTTFGVGRFAVISPSV